DNYNSTYDTYNYYSGKIKAGAQYGAGIEYNVQNHYSVELLYLHQATTAPTTYQAGNNVSVKTENFNVDMNYILFGAERHQLAPSGKVEGFGGIFAGVDVIDVSTADNAKSGSQTKFAWMLRMGAILWTAGPIGIRLQAQLNSVSQGMGGGLYFGTGGAGVGLSTYSTIYQFGLGGGIVIKLKNKSQ